MLDSSGSAAKRDCWSIESALHYRLDEVLDEDKSRVRTPKAAHALGMFRRLAVDTVGVTGSTQYGAPFKNLIYSDLRKSWCRPHARDQRTPRAPAGHCEHSNRVLKVLFRTGRVECTRVKFCQCGLRKIGNRNPESQLAGAAAIHLTERSSRTSHDLDLFHDSEQAVADAFAKDRSILEKNGYALELLLSQPGFIRARIGKEKQGLLVDWAYDSAWRFMPPVPLEGIGYVLHPVDQRLWVGATR